MTRAGEHATRLRESADGLLARRDELRGRLDAYRAKAAAKGLAENDELTSRYEQARALLFAAPCDLRGSTRAVFAYQQPDGTYVIDICTREDITPGRLRLLLDGGPLFRASTRK